MNLLLLTLRNARRAPLRAAMTVLAVAITLVAFLLLRAISAGYTNQVEQTPNNRVVSRHKVGWGQSLPVHYTDEVRQIPGIETAMGGQWAEVKYPANEKSRFFVTAVDATPFAKMHYELEAPAEQKRAWVANRRGAMVAKELADELGWQLGDNIHLEGTAFRGQWDLEVVCIFHSTRHGFAHHDVWMHWEYYNEQAPAEEQDRINIISAEIHDPAQGANIARSIDIHFDERDIQTLTQEDQALNASFVGMFGAILRGIDIVSLLVLGITMLLLGNTVAMSARERTHEYGILRALGFLPKHVAGFILGEAGVLGLVGGLLGVGLSYPLVERAVSRFLEEEMQFAPLQVPPDAALVAILLGGALGMLAAGLPAYRAGKLEVVESLRHVT